MHRSSRHLHGIVAVAVAVAGFAAVSLANMSEASACGGFFCNRSQPVNQADENIVFTANDDGTVTALIQIQYQGPADEFAWLLPVYGEPEVGVSSSTVFQRLTSATSPQYRIDRTVEGECRSRRADFDRSPGADAGVAAGAGADAASESVDVVDSGAVGPYRYSVISVEEGTDDPAQKALDWLESNNYDLTDLGPDLIAEYLEQDMNLIAYKLQKESQSGDIRPVKITYRHPLPMIPLKLTAVAAQQDMGVRVWLGGDDRAVPTRFKGVELNPAAINWFNWRSDYNRIVTEAADEAGGRAFVTEFAGDSSAVENSVFGEGQVDRWEQFDRPDEWSDRQGELIIRTLRNYARWDGMLRVVRQEISLPENVSAREFANRPFSYIDRNQEQVDGFEPASYLESLDENVISPVRSAEELMQEQPYVTRLYTTVSPDEMTEDPTFDFNADLDDVNRQRTAEQTVYCSDKVTRFQAPWEMELPDGQVVYGEGRGWPLNATGDAEVDVPAARKVREYGMTGSPEVVEDQTDEAKEAVSEHNDDYNDPSVPDDDNVGPDLDSSEPAQTSQTNRDGASWGCGCSSGSVPAALGDGLLALLVLLVGWGRRE